MTDEEYNERTKEAAFQIVTILRGLVDSDPRITRHLQQVTQARVQRMMSGEQVIIDNVPITEVSEPVENLKESESDQDTA